MKVEAKQRVARYFKDSKGREPAKDWLNRLRDGFGQAKIYTRIARAEGGNFGEHRSVGEGVSELKIDTGPGYRVYFALDENDEIILLLVAGDKSTQAGDIAEAKKHWKSHKGK